MKKKHSIALAIVSGVIVLGVLFIPNTTMYKDYRQSKFLMNVVDKTQNISGYKVNLNAAYNILSYEMDLKSEGEVALNKKQTSHLNYLVKMNGQGVSPMTVDLEQYAQFDEDQTILYMSLNGGQWFKEAKSEPSRYFDYFVDFNNLNYINDIYVSSRKSENNDFSIIENTETQQIISVKVDFLSAEPMLQVLISNILKFSPDIDLIPIYEKAPKVEYKFTIDKETKHITNYELDYTEGIQTIVKEVSEVYASKFASITPEKLALMTMTIDVQFSKMNEIESVVIPTNVSQNAVEVGQIK